VSFVSRTNITSLSFDLNGFIQKAVAGGKIQSGWYLTNVFAGFEIWNGGVGLKTTDFSITVN
jgi:cellulose 1,4-beta-cellobiosidase